LTTTWFNQDLLYELFDDLLSSIPPRPTDTSSDPKVISKLYKRLHTTREELAFLQSELDLEREFRSVLSSLSHGRSEDDILELEDKLMEMESRLRVMTEEKEDAQKEVVDLRNAVKSREDEVRLLREKLDRMEGTNKKQEKVAVERTRLIRALAESRALGEGLKQELSM
jgi:chromosome segregation ATPase